MNEYVVYRITEMKHRPYRLIDFTIKKIIHT